MKTSTFILLALISIPQTLFGQGFLQVNQTKGDINSATAEGCDLVCDNDGNTYVAGNFDNTVLFGDLEISGNYGTMYVVKYASDGDPVWVRQINGNSNNEVFGIAVDNQQDIYICGMYKHTNSSTVLDFGTIQIEGNRSLSTYLAKIDKNGNWLWARSILSEDFAGSQVCQPDDIIVSPSGDVFIAGSLNTPVSIDGSTFNSDNGSENAYYFARFSADGNLIWFNSNKGYFDGIELAFASDARLFFAGTSHNLIHFAGDSIEGPGSDDVLFGAINQDGSLLWWQTAGHPSYIERPKGLALDQNNNIYLAFSNQYWVKVGDLQIDYNGVVFQYLYKFDDQGNFLWMQPLLSGSVGGFNGISSLDILADPSGKTYVTGLMESSSYNGNPLFFSDTVGGYGYKECYLAAYNQDGSYAGVADFTYDEGNGGSGEFIPSQLAFDKDMNIVMTGTFRDNIMIGDKQLEAGAIKRMFVLKANPSELFGTSSGFSVLHIHDFDMDIYPNPARHTLNIEINENSGPYEYRLTDIHGRILLSGAGYDSRMKLDIGELEYGAYFVQVFGRKLVGKKAFIKL